MNVNIENKQCFILKGRALTLTVFHLVDMDIAGISLQLEQTIAKAPGLFNETPIVIDSSALTIQETELSALCKLLRSKKLIPVALQCNNSALAKSQGLAYLKPSSSTNVDRNLSIETSKSTNKKSQAKATNKIITTPVRSGQQIVSQNGDLIVVGAVSHGAELLSEGNIHIYGVLRGRALAGIAGDLNARIFCQALDAELIAIAGVYRLKETIEPLNSPCQIYLKDEHIYIEPLS